MNRRQKIIVSITGIFIVLLALVGLTYAYFLTRITGNENPKSISVTTANLELVYGDGNEIITANNIMPNTTIREKTFTVTNTGNSTVENYKVVLELASIEGVVPSIFKYPNDFEISLTCVSKNNTTNEVSGTCNGYNGYWNNETFEMNTNTIAAGIRHEYSLIIKYVDSGIDQSDDMGKNLNLKVQIYGSNETSTIAGTITGVDNTYAMKLNSEPKVSVLKPTGVTGEYKYVFTGVETGTHTLSLVNKDGEVVSTETITINKGTETSVNGSTITVTENQSIIHLTTNRSGNTLSSSAGFNPYGNSTNSLAYHIINNAIQNKNGTTFANVPLTKPIEEVAPVVSKGRAEFAVNEITLDLTTTHQGWYWTYATDYEIDGTTGLFSLKEPKICKYNESNCLSDLVSAGKTVYLIGGDKGTNASDSATLKNTENKRNIFLVTSAPASSSSTITIKIKKMSAITYNTSTEKILTVTTDDYGMSYYYRGGVEDNYVNFASKCWRIVRIAGDGSIKLILEDSNQECNSKDVAGNLNMNGDWWNNRNVLFGNNNNNADFLNYTGGLADSFKSFQTSELTTTDLEKLKVDEWCYDDNLNSDSFYAAYSRLVTNKKPSLICTGTKLTKFKDKTDMYVGTLTADEMAFAGAVGYSATNHFYLMNSSTISNNISWWSLTPREYLLNDTSDAVYVLRNLGGLSSSYVNQTTRYSRPAITLKSGTIITLGEGTQEKPYVIG